MQEGTGQDAGQKPKRTPRARREFKDAPTESVKKRTFGRLARKELTRAHDALRKEQSEAGQRDVTERESGEQEVASVQKRVDELKAALESADEVMGEVLQGLLKEQEVLLAERKAALEQLPVRAEQEHVFVDKARHEQLLRRIEDEMGQLFAGERRIERLLTHCVRHETWSDYKLEGFGLFIDKAYLQGSTERVIIQAYQNDPQSVPERVRRQIDIGLKQLAEKKVEGRIPAAITDASLRDALRQRLRKEYEAPEALAKVLEEHIQNKDHAPLVSLDKPDVAMVAVREAMLSKGLLTEERMYDVLASFLADDYGSRVSQIPADERAKILAAYWSGGRRPLEDEEMALMKKWGVTMTGWGAIDGVRKKIESETYRLGRIEEKEKEIDELTSRDWSAVVAKEYAEATVRYIGRWESDMRSVKDDAVRFKEHVEAAAAGEAEALRLKADNLVLQTAETFPVSGDGWFGALDGLRKLSAKLKEIPQSYRDLLSGKVLTYKDRATHASPEADIHEKYRRWEEALDLQLRELGELVASKYTPGIDNDKVAQHYSEKRAAIHAVKAKAEREKRDQDNAALSASRRQAQEALKPVAEEMEAAYKAAAARHSALENSVNGTRDLLFSKLREFETELGGSLRFLRGDETAIKEGAVRRAEEAQKAAENHWNPIGKQAKIDAAKQVVKDAKAEVTKLQANIRNTEAKFQEVRRLMSMA